MTSYPCNKYEQITLSYLLRVKYVYTYMYMYTYIYIHVYIHTYIYMYTYIHIYIHVYIHTYIHTYVYIHTYIHMYTYIHTYVYIHTYIHMYIHVYIDTHVYTCIHTYTCIYIVYMFSHHLHCGTLHMNTTLWGLQALWGHTPCPQNNIRLNRSNMIQLGDVWTLVDDSTKSNTHACGDKCMFMHFRQHRRSWYFYTQIFQNGNVTTELGQIYCLLTFL